MDDYIKERKDSEKNSSNGYNQKIIKNKSRDTKSNGILSNTDLKSVKGNNSRNNKRSKELFKDNTVDIKNENQGEKVEIKNLNNSDLEEIFGKRTSLIHGADTKTDF